MGCACWKLHRRGVETMRRLVRPAVVRREIDFSDLPEASDEQLRTMRRVGRPPIGTHARQLIAIRLDPEVRGVNYYCRLTTTISAGEGPAKGCSRDLTDCTG